MLVTTYGVGELSAINGVMGAKAERCTGFSRRRNAHSYQHQRLHKIAHHTLGDGVFGNFVELSGGAACCHAVINPENCVVEMERIIAEARRNHQPAYIAVPSDYALSPVVSADVKPIVPRSNEAALQKAMAIIAERINKAKSIVAFPAFTISRLGLQKEAQKAIEALGCPFVTTLMEKCVIGESHPQFAGMYAGAVSEPKTRQIIEGADLVLDLGGVNLNDITTAAYSGQLDLSRFVTVGLDDVRIGDQVIANVRLEDILSELAKLKPSSAPYKGKPAGARAGKAKRKAVRQDHDGRALSALRRVSARRRHGRSRDRQLKPRRDTNDPSRRRAGGSARSVGIDRLRRPRPPSVSRLPIRAGAQFWSLAKARIN